MFAECRSSDTRQNQSLPSASDETLGKHNFAECLKKYTRQTSSRAPHVPVTVGWRSGRYCLPSAGYGTLGKPSFAECLTVNTRQTMSRAPHTTVTTTVTPLPRPVPVTTSVTVTSCRVRGVGYSAKYILPSAVHGTLGNVLSMPSALCWHSASSHLCRVSFLALGKVREKHFHLPSKLFSLLL